MATVSVGRSNTSWRDSAHMRFQVEDLLVDFPYPRIYPEQYAYMLALKRSLDRKGHSLLELPMGGRSVALLSLITSYQLAHPEACRKLVYCTTSAAQMEKVLETLALLERHRDELLGEDRRRLLGVGLSAHARTSPTASEPTYSLDPYALDPHGYWLESDDDVGGVQLAAAEETASLPPGVHTPRRLKALAASSGMSGVALARCAAATADVVVCTYPYVLDPKISGLVRGSTPRESVIVFDDAQSLDTACTEQLSLHLRVPTLNSCSSLLRRLSTDVAALADADGAALTDEYTALVENRDDAPADDEQLPCLGGYGVQPPCSAAQPAPDAAAAAAEERRAVPGNLRRASHFLAFMRRLVRHTLELLAAPATTRTTPAALLLKLLRDDEIEAPALLDAGRRLRSLLRTLRVGSLDDFVPLLLLTDFYALAATPACRDGLLVLAEPSDPRTPTQHDPLLQLCCLEPSLVLAPLLASVQSVVLTAGSLSPPELYAKLLRIEPCVAFHAADASCVRHRLCPLVVSRGSDQAAFVSRAEPSSRQEGEMARNYGKLLVEMAATVPDGVLALVPSPADLGRWARVWEACGVLRQLLNHKLVFFETSDAEQTAVALEHYKRACDVGRGGVFVTTPRSRVVASVDFDGHYGRATLLLGLPTGTSLSSSALQARLDYLRTTADIDTATYLTFDALRLALGCAARSVRDRRDYGVLVLADRRFGKADKQALAPAWLRDLMKPEVLSLSTEGAVSRARLFLQHAAQEHEATPTRAMSLDELHSHHGFVGATVGAVPVKRPSDKPTASASGRKRAREESHGESDQT